jgi:hypothetical protein
MQKLKARDEPTIPDIDKEYYAFKKKTKARKKLKRN